MQLQARISALENGIADRRELYNEAVNLRNTRIEQFPDLLLARWFGFVGKPLLGFSAEQTADVDLKANCFRPEWAGGDDARPAARPPDWACSRPAAGAAGLVAGP